MYTTKNNVRDHNHPTKSNLTPDHVGYTTISTRSTKFTYFISVAWSTKIVWLYPQDNYYHHNNLSLMLSYRRSVLLWHQGYSASLRWKDTCSRWSLVPLRTRCLAGFIGDLHVFWQVRVLDTWPENLSRKGLWRLVWSSVVFQSWGKSTLLRVVCG